MAQSLGKDASARVNGNAVLDYFARTLGVPAVFLNQSLPLNQISQEGETKHD